MGTTVALRKPTLRRLLCPVIGGWGMENLSNGPYKEECKPWKVKGLRTETKQGERISGHKRCFPLGWVGLGGLGRPFLYPALPGEAPAGTVSGCGTKKPSSPPPGNSDSHAIPNHGPSFW
jgi:hypothetical protein